MTVDFAVRLTEILLGIALVQQCAEYSVLLPRHRLVVAVRLLFSGLLIVGVAPVAATSALIIIGLWLLIKFNGPYNGGSDRMSLLVLICLWGAHLAPNQYWREIAFAYLALQLVLSYFLSGAVKIVKADWRNGRALRDVFLFSAYPVAEATRKWADSPRLLFVMSWAVMLFELIFPVVIVSQAALLIALFFAFVFHLSNAYFFGLNRFVWAWGAAYPSLLWFQGKMFPG